MSLDVTEPVDPVCSEQNPLLGGSECYFLGITSPVCLHPFSASGTEGCSQRIPWRVGVGPRELEKVKSQKLYYKTTQNK